MLPLNASLTLDVRTLVLRPLPSAFLSSSHPIHAFLNTVVSIYLAFAMSSVANVPGSSASTSTSVPAPTPALPQSCDHSPDDDKEVSETESESSSRSVTPEPRWPSQAKVKRPPFPFEYGVRVISPPLLKVFDDILTFVAHNNRNVVFARCFPDPSCRVSSILDMLPWNHPPIFRSVGSVCHSLTA